MTIGLAPTRENDRADLIHRNVVFEVVDHDIECGVITVVVRIICCVQNLIIGTRSEILQQGDFIRLAHGIVLVGVARCFTLVLGNLPAPLEL